MTHLKVIEQWTLTVIKLKDFCINICCFSTRFYFFCNTVAQSHPNFIKIVDVFDGTHPMKPERSLHG